MVASSNVLFFNRKENNFSSVSLEMLRFSIFEM